eukprot:m.163683 g.163683  ORF g.163683 m.163683 type:complete len:1050 (+) comp12325_c0_seq1:204-3353(+)
MPPSKPVEANEAGASANVDSTPPKRGPMRMYTDRVMKRPVFMCSLFFAIPIFFSIVGLIAYPIEIQTGGGAWYPRESDAGRREDGLIRAEEETVFNPSDEATSSIVTDQQEALGTSIVLYFWTEDGSNMLDSAGLAKMREVEQYIVTRQNFSDFCLKDESGTECLEVDSLTQYVYSVPLSCNSSLYNPNGNATDQVSSNITQLLLPILDPSMSPVYCTDCAGNCSGQGEDSLDDFVIKTFTSSSMFSWATKSNVRFGLPLQGYSNAYDRREDQIDKINDWILEMYDQLMEDGFSNNGYVVRALNDALVGRYFDNILNKDIIWVFLAIALVGVFVLINTGAPLLTAFGMLHIILSFPFSYFFLQLFFQIGSLGFLNFLTVFIILGIGADDIFILLDAWKQSANSFANLPDSATSEERQQYLGERLYWTYRRAAWAMLVTSLTTSAAFFMNVVSSVIPIQVFGIQTAFMVLTNYFMVVTYYPALLIVWEWYNIHSWCKCCCKKTNTSGEDPTSAGTVTTAVPTETARASQPNIYAPPARVQTDAMDAEKGGQHAVHNIEEYRWMERFLHNTWAPGVYRYRYFSLAGFSIFLIICAVFAAQIEVSEEPTKWIPDSDNLQQVFNIEREHFEGTLIVQLSIVSGIDTVDRKGANPFNGDDIGNPRFVSNFDMSPPEAQQAYVDNCITMMSWDYVMKNSATNESGVLCPMIEFKDYIENELSETFPVPQNMFITRLLNFTDWIEQDQGPGIDASLFNDLGGREARRSTLASIQQTIRFRKGNNDPAKLGYMLTAVNTTLGAQDSAAQTEPVFNYFEAEISRLQTTSTYRTSFQTAPKYLWMRLEQGLKNDAVFSILVSLLLTFVIVCASTRDILVSVMATATIGFIVLTMIANVVWLGWKISVIESICLTILVGLSVDYTIHLANAWQSQTWTTDRLQRLNAALLEIGISVLAAATTTFLSAIPLLLCIIVFFYKFGCFIMLSVVWSTVFAFGAFLTMMSILGPVTNRNDFYYLYLKARGLDTDAAYFKKVDPPHREGEKVVTDENGSKIVVSEF